MSSSRVQNVLIVLSPLSLIFMQAGMAAEAATNLKEKGAVRADLTMDPRLNLQASRHLNAYPVPDFTQTARSLSRDIFRPMVGNSDVQDFSNAVGRYFRQEMPDLYSLSNIGSLFARAQHDGKHLGLALYTALHGKSSDRKPYTHLVYPDMTPHARTVLSAKLGGQCVGVDKKSSYGVSIDLRSVRERISLLTGAGSLQPQNRIQ